MSFTVATLDDFVKNGIRDISMKIPIHEDRCGVIHTAYKEDVDVRASVDPVQNVEIITIHDVQWKDRGRLQVLPASLLPVYAPATQLTAGPDPAWTRRRGLLLHLEPPVSAAPTSTTLSGSATSTATTISLTSVSGFRTRGFAKIESEWIYWGTITGSTLTNVVRGVGPTTAAAHSSGVTITQADLIVDYARTAKNPASDTETIDLPDICFEALVLWVCYECWLMLQNDAKAAQYLALYRDEMGRLRSELGDYLSRADEHILPYNMQTFIGRPLGAGEGMEG
jgi:hypothetical protein